MTVIGRRSAPPELGPNEGGACAWGGLMASARVAEAALSSSIADMANDGDAEVLEVVDRQPRQHRAVDLIVPERRLVFVQGQGSAARPRHPSMFPQRGERR